MIRLASLDRFDTSAALCRANASIDSVRTFGRVPRVHLPRAAFSMETPISDRLSYLSPESVVERSRGKVTLVTPASMRRAGGGPGWVRLRGRILYPLPAVELFERKLALAGEVA